jgi:hypothetical protein
MDAKFNELTKLYKNSPNYKADDEDLKNLIAWSHEYKKEQAVVNNFIYYGYYIIVIFIVIFILIFIYSAYANIKPDTKLLDEMKDPKNKSNGVEIIDTDIEYDDEGNQIIYVDD